MTAFWNHSQNLWSRTAQGLVVGRQTFPKLQHDRTAARRFLVNLCFFTVPWRGAVCMRAMHRQQVALAVGSATATGEEQREQGSCFIAWPFWKVSLLCSTDELVR